MYVFVCVCVCVVCGGGGRGREREREKENGEENGEEAWDDCTRQKTFNFAHVCSKHWFLGNLLL
jgi:hypothetical protein